MHADTPDYQPDPNPSSAIYITIPGCRTRLVRNVNRTLNAEGNITLEPEHVIAAYSRPSLVDRPVTIIHLPRHPLLSLLSELGGLIYGVTFLVGISC